MEQEILFSNIYKLETPVGFFCVLSDNDEMIPFSVVNNLMNRPVEAEDENGNILGIISTDTNYRIMVDATLLDVGRNYRVLFSKGTWAYLECDEHSICYDTILGEWVVGIGAYDPTDDEKMNQIFENKHKTGVLQELKEYDESRFLEYTVYSVDDCNGFRFKLIDNTPQTIPFEVAWIKAEKYPVLEYEGALGVWLC